MPVFINSRQNKLVSRASIKRCSTVIERAIFIWMASISGLVSSGINRMLARWPVAALT